MLCPMSIQSKLWYQLIWNPLVVSQRNHVWPVHLQANDTITWSIFDHVTFIDLVLSLTTLQDSSLFPNCWKIFSFLIIMYFFINHQRGFWEIYEHYLRDGAREDSNHRTSSSEGGVCATCCARLGHNQLRNPNQQREMQQRSIQKTKTNKRERKQTQYLTRFGNFPTSWGKGREIFIDSTTNTSFFKGYNSWGLYPYIYSQRVSEF